MEVDIHEYIDNYLKEIEKQTEYLAHLSLNEKEPVYHPHVLLFYFTELMNFRN